MSTHFKLQRAPSISSGFPERFVAHSEISISQNNPTQTCSVDDASCSIPTPQSSADKRLIVEQPPVALKTLHTTTDSHYGDPATTNTKTPISHNLVVPLPPVPSSLISGSLKHETETAQLFLAIATAKGNQMSTQYKLERAPSISSCFPERFVAYPEISISQNNPTQTCNVDGASCSIPIPQSSTDERLVVEQPPVVSKTPHTTTDSHYGGPATANAKTPISHPASASALASTPPISGMPLPHKLAVPLPPVPSSPINRITKAKEYQMPTQHKLQRALSISSCFPERFVAHPEISISQNNPTQTCNVDDASCSVPIPQSSTDKRLVVEQPPVVSKTLHITTDSHYGDPATAKAKTPTSYPASASASTPSSSCMPLPHKLAVPLPPVINKENASRRGSLYAPLYHAAMKGDWESAQKFLRSHPGALNVRITKEMDTLLHIAAGAKQTKFVEEVVKLMSPADLELRNKANNTALFYAAASGVTRIAEIMVLNNRKLPRARNIKGVTSLYVAALFGHREMVWYLYSVTSNEELKQDDYVALLTATIQTDLFDVALKILQDQPELATIRDLNGMTALHILAQKPSAFVNKSSLTPWHRILYPLIQVVEPSQDCCFSGHLISQNSNNHRASSSLLQKLWHGAAFIVPGVKLVCSRKSMHMQALRLVKIISDQLSLFEDSKTCDLLTNPTNPLLLAAEFGIAEVVSELISSYPDIIWNIDKQSRNIFHIAVMYRQEKIFNLIHDIGAHKDMITSYRDANGQNLLHLAGKLPPLEHLSTVSGAALQMQRELLWFKEVEKTLQPLAKQMRDKSDRIPRMLFTEEHRALVKEGEQWMKSTANSCMLVATLITTVMFAAIFTVPGGNDNNKGTPILRQLNAFTTFAMSDAFALFSSVTSILMFLSILTSRYAEEDFLESLPKRLIVGLATLFLSIASMLVAFSATFFIVLGHQVAWMVVPIALVACVPVILFAFSQFPLLADMFRSCYGPGIFARDCIMLY